MFSEIKHGIRNLIYWLPVIWKDRWWDDHYIYAILRHKLLNMAHMFEKYGISTVSKSDAEEMRYAAALLKRLMDEDYLENAWPKDIKIESWREATEEEGDAIRRAGRHADYMKQQDLDTLLEIFRKHIFGWWD